jgi:5,10-methylene-tetrahydrofolate dehydrogenase/methenyl tetrahydrofolate cyclohydrolase
MSPAPTDPRLMDGTAVSQALLAETAQRADRLTRETGRPPYLAAVLVGEDRASVTYQAQSRASARPMTTLDPTTKPS